MHPLPLLSAVAALLAATTVLANEPTSGPEAPLPSPPAGFSPPPQLLAFPDAAPGDPRLSFPECAGIPPSDEAPFYDYNGLSGRYAGSRPAAEGQPLQIGFALTSSGPGPWAEGEYSGWFMTAEGAARWHAGHFRALAVNPAFMPSIVLTSGFDTANQGYSVLGLRKDAASGRITALCLYSWRQEWPPTVFPRRPFALWRMF
ncbi:hypothetical protein OOT46_28030 [Aquabacterium sp. A7-Y]|uniref:hypothetical protein n=1 Tax=Aquabacterium sp. A7-Y TaxID=1349605 RepID=UPI00223CE067|nr:hypothetical protein [Aquabacterium sp. A7-Y]MCW7541653.1 hypothetical protein [Aquabacterium sp. A7-Y]